MTDPAATITATPAAAGTPNQVSVDYVGGEAYDIRVRGHRVRTDQPVRDGGTDRAPTPTELFVGSLAACVAYYAGRYLVRHGLRRHGLRVRASFELATDRPARVATVRIVLRPPAGLPAERIPALLAVASHCTVHNSITHPPEITVSVEPTG